MHLTGASEHLRPVYLHGALGERFGHVHELAVASTVEAVRALSALRPGFREAIGEGTWRVVSGDARRGFAIGEDELRFGLGRGKPLHIIPVAQGAGGRGGLGKIVAGLAMVAGAFFLGPAGFLGGAGGFAGGLARAAVGIGASMALNGVSALLTAKPNASNGRAGVDDRTSFLFNGPVNVSAQGGAVPLVFGRFRVGSNVISAGLTADAAT